MIDKKKLFEDMHEKEPEKEKEFIGIYNQSNFKGLKPPTPLFIIVMFQWGVFGLLYVLWLNEFLIWQGPDRPEYRAIPPIINEPAKVFFIKNNELKDDNFLITYQYEEEKAIAILDQWAAMLWQEKLIHQRITADFISIDKKSRTLYCSASRRIFSKHMSAADKLRILYGLFKTIKENNMNISHCLMLHHHDFLVDEHIDMSCAWPIDIIDHIE